MQVLQLVSVRLPNRK